MCRALRRGLSRSGSAAGGDLNRPRPRPLTRRLSGWLWDRCQPLRRPARRWRQQLSLAAYGLRHKLGRHQPPRIVHFPAATKVPPRGPVADPAIRLEAAGGADLEGFFAGQTETSFGHGESASTPRYVLTLAAGQSSLPATFAESLLLATAAEDLSWAQGGLAAPAGPDPGASALGLDASSANTLIRLPGGAAGALERASEVQGREVLHITAPTALDVQLPEPPLPLPRAGHYWLRDDLCGGQVVRQPVFDLSSALAALPTIDGPPTALMLLPFLAVGGAENLLFDLLEGLSGRYRMLVVTTEPHRAELGQTVDRCRQLTPHVYTLGDWLPRIALAGALRHLLRRWQVECLMSWNGTVAFYDWLGELRADHPELRLVDQHFNHRGGWIEHLTPRTLGLLDATVAVNRPTAAALGDDYGARPEQVRLIHHGVRLPTTRSAAEITRRKQSCRELFGLPQDAVVVGTFVRLHPQKRPFDVLALARRLRDRGVWFLLAGGGPLDGSIDRELLRRPLDNLLRLPLQDDVEPLYATVDLCLSTSAFEGLPVFLLDALARELPVVATAVGDVPLLLADGGGLLVDRPGDLGALEAALLSLLDPAERQRRGAIGRATVAEKFGLESYCQAYEELLFPGGGGQ